jgi:hypothetical protein
LSSEHPPPTLVDLLPPAAAVLFHPLQLEGLTKVLLVLLSPDELFPAPLDEEAAVEIGLSSDMSTTVDVFIKFKGSKKQLLKILAEDFLILVNGKNCWLFHFIEIGLSQRSEVPDYFVGHPFRPYNFVLGSSTYIGSSCCGTVRRAYSIIMDTLAQMLAVRLEARTMSYFAGVKRRYRYVRAMKRNKFSVLLDEETGKPPVGFFNP